MKKRASRADEDGINRMMKDLGFAKSDQSRLSTPSLQQFSKRNWEFLSKYRPGAKQSQPILDRSEIIVLIKRAYLLATDNGADMAKIKWHTSKSTALCPKVLEMFPYNTLSTIPVSRNQEPMQVSDRRPAKRTWSQAQINEDQDSDNSTSTESEDEDRTDVDEEQDAEEHAEEEDEDEKEEEDEEEADETSKWEFNEHDD